MISTLKFFRLFFLIALGIGINFASTAKASAPNAEPQPIKTEWTQAEVRELVDYYADINGISRSVLHTVIEGESGYVYDEEGDGGNSWGACQINLPSHPDVTKEEANNPDFCLDWTAKHIKAGRGRLWTVYRTCVLRETVVHKGKVIPCMVK